jgi:hypothetical protein
MKKEIGFSTKGNRANVELLNINRMLPNRYVNKVGPFVFLDYVAPAVKELICASASGNCHAHIYSSGRRRTF